MAHQTDTRESTNPDRPGAKPFHSSAGFGAALFFSHGPNSSANRHRNLDHHCRHDIGASRWRVYRFRCCRWSAQSVLVWTRSRIAVWGGGRTWHLVALGSIANRSHATCRMGPDASQLPSFGTDSEMVCALLRRLQSACDRVSGSSIWLLG